MAKGSTRLLCTLLLAVLLLHLTTVVDASVTWRRVTKRTLQPTSTSVTVSATTSTTKSPITWKRSTIVRRSTTDVEHTESDTVEIESDEIQEASSRQDDYVADEEIENDSEVKPLVPGSRPGFWFDSKRRKKPSTLLRPGARRNSLFPNRSSTTTTPVPTTVSITPLSVVPRTPPTVANSNAKNASTKQFGRNRSTKSPITFRRRPKTTKPAVHSSTTKLPQKQEDIVRDSNKLSHDDDTNDESDKNPEKLEDKVDKDDVLITKYPASTIRRRPYNATRLPWVRQNSRTTAAPQQVPTTSSERLSTTSDSGNIFRESTKLPKTRTRLRVRTSPAPDTFKKVQTTVSPSTTTEDIKRIKDEREPRPAFEAKDVLKTKKTQNFEIKNSEDDIEIEDNFSGDTKKSSLQEPKLKVHTTIEPYFLTREYGRVLTVVPDLKVTSIENVATTASPPRKTKKRIRPKVTETTTTSIPTTIAETLNAELQYDTSSDFSIDDDNEYTSIYTTVEPIAPPEIEKYVEKVQDDFIYHPVSKSSTTISPVSKSSTTISPVSRPNVPTIDPNSDTYVVWSLGQGGSGWSYQKHGGEVKWSAQNSEAEDDRWSVVSKDEAESIDADLNQQWLPVRNSSVHGHTKSETLETVLRSNKNNKQSAKVRNNGEKSFSYVTYTPKLSYKNETIINIKTSPNESGNALQAQNISNLHFFPPAQYSTSVSVGGIKSLDSNNDGTNLDKPSQVFIQESDKVPYTSQTPVPFSPTLEDKYNEEIQGILNPYPVVPNYPYVAEIRDTYNNLPNIATDPPTNIFEVQEYVTETVTDSREKVTTTPVPLSQAQWFSQEQQPNTYPTAYPQTENVDPYGKFTADDLLKEEPVYNQVSPVQISHQNYLSNIPPELAKAVVDEKKWHVVGPGGDEGWSLLNEDGVLEWKIHNVDGKWRVTSADQLLKMFTPQQATYNDSNEDIIHNNTEHNRQAKSETPKVWTLEDDYAKWQAVSAERANPSDESLEDTSLSSEEYDYDSHEYQDYYNPDDYYSNVPPATAFNPNGDFGNRPIWGNDDYTIAQDYPKEDYPQFAGNIKFANTKDDAIAAWKSLMVQQGHWKFPDAVSNTRQTYPTEIPEYFQNKDRNTERLSTHTPALRQESDQIKKTNNFYEATKEPSAKSTSHRYENNGDLQSGRVHSPVNHENYHERKYEYSTKDESFDNGKNQLENGSERYEEGRLNTYEKNHEKQFEPRVRIQHKDQSKLDSLINKLETIQKEAKGRAVVDLTELLKQIKSRRNATYFDLLSTKNTNAKQNQRDTEKISNVKNDQAYFEGNVHVKNDQRNTEKITNIEYNKKNIEINSNFQHGQRIIENYSRSPNTQNRNNANKPLPVRSSSPVINQENLNQHSFNKNFIDADSNNRNYLNANNNNKNYLNANNNNKNYLNANNNNKNYLNANNNNKNYLNANNNNKENFPYDNRDSNHRVRHSKTSNGTNRRKQPTEKTQNRRIKESDEQNDYPKRRYPPARPTEQYIQESNKSNKQDYENVGFNLPQNKTPFYPRQTGPSQKSGERYTTNSEEKFVDLRGGRDIYQTTKDNVPQNKVSSYITHTGPVQKSAISAFNSQKVFVDLGDRKDVNQLNRHNILRNKASSYSMQTGLTQKLSKSETSSSEEIFVDLNGRKDMHQIGRYNVPQNKFSSYSIQNRPFQNSAKSDTSSSEEIFVDLRSGKDIGLTDKNNVPQRQISSYSRLNRPIQKLSNRDTSGSRKTFVDLSGDKEMHHKDLYNVPHNKVPSYSEQNRHVQKTVKSDILSSGAIFTDQKDEKETRNSHRRKQKLRKRIRKLNQSAPIVLKGETEVVEEGGSKKSRKIIVIDYAGAQKKNSSIDKKDLELIIKNVKYRRSELLEN